MYIVCSPYSVVTVTRNRALAEEFVLSDYEEQLHNLFNYYMQTTDDEDPSIKTFAMAVRANMIEDLRIIHLNHLLEDY